MPRVTVTAQLERAKQDINRLTAELVKLRADLSLCTTQRDNALAVVSQMPKSTEDFIAFAEAAIAKLTADRDEAKAMAKNMSDKFYAIKKELSELKALNAPNELSEFKQRAAAARAEAARTGKTVQV